MSLLPTERLGVVLAPRRIGRVRIRAGMFGQRATSPPATVALHEAGHDWRPALAALAQGLAAGPAVAQLSVLLSGCFVRVAQVPWAAGLDAGEDEALALARLEAHYGDMGGWQTAIGGGGYGEPRLVFAVERALLAGLADLAAAHRCDLAAVRPAFVEAWNQRRAEIGRDDAILAVVDSGLAVLGTRRRGLWQSIRGLRVPAGGVEELIEREALLQGFAGTPAQVLTCGATSTGGGDDDDGIGAMLALIAPPGVRTGRRP